MLRILRIGLGKDERHLDVLLGIITVHIDLERMRVKVLTCKCPSHAGREPLVETRLEEFPFVAVIRDDVLHRHSRHLQTFNDLEEHLRR